MPYVRKNRSGWEASARRLQIEASRISQLDGIRVVKIKV